VQISEQPSNNKRFREIPRKTSPNLAYGQVNMKNQEEQESENLKHEDDKKQKVIIESKIQASFKKTIINSEILPKN